MIKNVITALLVIMILLTPGAVLADTGTHMIFLCG